ncbi:DUF1446 domain-containing protein [Pseudonocardia kongjuensis]|uniref:DUF1446 domain-containing protein n=1 Tax=Pseudonocardia kongjuensis TaxID=102227 RepID=A0ABN1XH27_9PSEU
MATTTRIGCGAGFAGDRIDPAVELARTGELQDLVLECLAERTIALGQQRRLADPAAGYDPRLERRLAPLLPETLSRGVRVLTNMGAANPPAAGRVVRSLLDRLGSTAPVAVVTGDDVLDRIDPDSPALEDGRPLAAHGELVSANAYLGADALLPALDTAAAVVVTGRVADPSLFLAPLAHRLGWRPGDVPAAAAGTLVGHLLECAGQLTGGYFADPGHSDVERPAHLGFPWAQVRADGSAVFGKPAGSGGRLDRHTVRQQLLYEVTDPTAYRTPDVVLDLRGVRVTDEGPDRVRVDGAAGRERPDELKVSVGYRAGHRVEAEISYVGPNAAARAGAAADIVGERVRGLGAAPRIEVRGGGDDCRLRLAALGADRDVLDTLAHEVESLYTNGPAGGGGFRSRVDEVVGVLSTLVPRSVVEPRVTLLEGRRAAA